MQAVLTIPQQSYTFIQDSGANYITVKSGTVLSVLLVTPITDAFTTSVSLKVAQGRTGGGRFSTTVRIFSYSPVSSEAIQGIQESGGTTISGIRVAPGVWQFSGHWFDAFKAHGPDPLGATMGNQ